MALNAVVEVGLIGGVKRKFSDQFGSRDSNFAMCSKELKLTPSNISEELEVTPLI
jgi:hypothetical protein